MTETATCPDCRNPMSGTHAEACWVGRSLDDRDRADLSTLADTGNEQFIRAASPSERVRFSAIHGAKARAWTHVLVSPSENGCHRQPLTVEEVAAMMPAAKAE